MTTKQNAITRFGVVDGGDLLSDLKGTPLLFRSKQAALRYTQNDGGCVVVVTVTWESTPA